MSTLQAFIDDVEVVVGSTDDEHEITKRVGELLSALLASDYQLPPEFTRPSADHATGKFTPGPSLSIAADETLCGFVPSAFMTYTDHLPSRLVVNAIMLPSGDQTGRRLHRVAWNSPIESFLIPLPSTFIPQTPGHPSRLLSKAID